MGNGSGVSRGDRNRNARLERRPGASDERDRRDRPGGQEADGRGDRSRFEGHRAADVPVPRLGPLARRWTGPPGVPWPVDGLG